ncbi:MAG: endonuclease VIII [Candidatus Dojkabacteria bacterium]|nr:endonuclease VIII [Candidatus Dojkabacteria bacterium]
MIEIPEAIVMSQQISQYLKGKKIRGAIAMHSPHKLVWTFKDPRKYSKMLAGQSIIESYPFGSIVEISLGKVKLAFSEGFNLRFIEKESELPKKHQLLLEFDDGTFLAAWVQMYGGLACFQKDEYDNKYYLMAKGKPAVFSKEFDPLYWKSLFTPETEKLSAKAFLATEQRIPGLGNGVLQDILFNAKIHPKRKINSLGENVRQNLYNVVVSTLNEMVSKGGRDTEKDLLGNVGGYETKMSAKTVGSTCSNCKGKIKKMAYMGGSVYVCEKCQKL